MPSYRVTLLIGDMRVGRSPEEVLPAAVDAARELTTAESWDLAIRHGMPRITVRYIADDDAEAFRVAELVRARTNLVAQARGTTVTRRYGGRFYPVAPPHDTY